MGYGAYMNVANNRSESITTYVNDVNCVYEHGQSDNSHLEYFNDRQIAAQSTYPGGKGQYFEAKNSGSCFFESSAFTLKATSSSTGVTLGQVSFSDSAENWEVESNTNKDLINVNIDNSGDKARITITVVAT